MDQSYVTGKAEAVKRPELKSSTFLISIFHTVKTTNLTLFSENIFKISIPIFKLSISIPFSVQCVF